METINFWDIAKEHKEAVSKSIKKMLEKKLRNGEWVAKAPYGYKRIRDEEGKRKIVVDEFQAAIVQELFELYATGAFTLELLSQKINALHETTFTKDSLEKLLSNPFYHGVMVVKGKEYLHYHPTLISKTTFDEVQTVKK